MDDKKRIFVGKRGYRAVFGIYGKKASVRVKRLKGVRVISEKQLAELAEHQAVMMIIMPIRED